MKKLIASIIAILIFSLVPVDGQIQPHRFSGVDLMSRIGWIASRYPWHDIPEISTVHPVPRLWTPYEQPSFFQTQLQNKQLDDYGSSADLLQFSVGPGTPDYNYWSRVYLGRCDRPFFIAYEHINGNLNYDPINGSKNMDLAINRQAFMRDIDFIVRNIIFSKGNHRCYVTLNGKGVIYLWGGSMMTGNFGSLLEEVTKKYPVTFIGSEGHFPQDENDMRRIKALSGIMQYAVGYDDADYVESMELYRQDSLEWRRILDNIYKDTGKKILLIPTFQAAYDETKYPDRAGYKLYPKTAAELENNAKNIRDSRRRNKYKIHDIYDTWVTHVIYSENFEGAAVIESQCTEETQNTPDRYTGCGLGRLEVLKKYLGNR